MLKREDTPPARLLEEALMILFCLMNAAYRDLKTPRRALCGSETLSNTAVMVLVLFQQLRGVESEHACLRDVARFFSYLSPWCGRARP